MPVPRGHPHVSAVHAASIGLVLMVILVAPTVTSGGQLRADSPQTLPAARTALLAGQVIEYPSGRPVSSGGATKSFGTSSSSSQAVSRFPAAVPTQASRPLWRALCIGLIFWHYPHVRSAGHE